MSATFRAPVQAVAWHWHAATTIKDADGQVLAECSGNGRYSAEDEKIAARMVRCINACDGLSNDALDGGWTALGMSRYAKSLEDALEHIVRRLQMDIDDGSRPDQWSMEDLVRGARKAIRSAA